MKQLETNMPRQIHRTTQKFFPTFTNKKSQKKSSQRTETLGRVSNRKQKRENDSNPKAEYTTEVLSHDLHQ